MGGSGASTSSATCCGARRPPSGEWSAWGRVSRVTSSRRSADPGGGAEAKPDASLGAPGLARHGGEPAMKVTILVQTLSEEKGIGPTRDSVDRKELPRRGSDLEFLVIDGPSKDRTKQEAEKRGSRFVVEPRRGYGRAYKRG